MNAEEFKRKFLPFHPKLYRIAYVLTGNREDAEDILQDTYCKLWQQRDELAQVENPEAFCITVLKHKCLDYLRSPGFNSLGEIQENQMSLLSGVSPDQELEMGEKLAEVRKAIDLLPENQRKVVKLYGIAECSCQEIEAITGLSNNNVRTLLSRARRALKDRLKRIGVL